MAILHTTYTRDEAVEERGKREQVGRYLVTVLESRQ